MMAKGIRLEHETAAERRRRVYNRERLKEEASMGLCKLIGERDGMKRAGFARLIGRSRSFVTKILDSHNFTLETLSDAYYALGYIVHLTLTPKELEGLRSPKIESMPPADVQNLENVFPDLIANERSGLTDQFIPASYGATSGGPYIFGEYESGRKGTVGGDIRFRGDEIHRFRAAHTG